MSASFTSFLDTQFGAPVPNPELHLIKHFRTQYPESRHLSVLHHWDSQFPLSAYLATLNITPSAVEDETFSVVHRQEPNGLYSEAIAGITEFTYDSVAFRVFKAKWINFRSPNTFYHLVFEGADDAVGKKLIDAVYVWANELKDEIWVFEGGCWSKNKKLYKAVKNASWDEVVLEDRFKEGLRRDTKTFFASNDAYESLQITWKRGILLLGPPGNGKTESIKALLHESTGTGVNPLYVKSFTTRDGSEQGIRSIFEHARTHSPCILILEDLDSMLTPEARAFFLNELDGLGDNEGILTIATTNHPERIDDAILNRPSRFDVKYDFTLPDSMLRKTFAEKWLAKVNGFSTNTGVSFAKPGETAVAVADKTEGWSFAFLKELFVSFLLRLAHDKSLRQTGVDVPVEPVEVLLMKQVEQLANQIIKTKDYAPDPANASRGQPVTSFMQARAMGVNEGPVVYTGVNF